MRTIPRLAIAAAGLTVAASGLVACHPPSGPWTECYNTRPHKTVDNVGGNSKAIFNIIYSCRLRHGTTDIYDTWCIMPDAHEIVVCTGPAGGLDEGDKIEKYIPAK